MKKSETEPKETRYKQIAVRMTTNEIKELKMFCLNHDMTVSDAVKNGIELLKGTAN